MSILLPALCSGMCMSQRKAKLKEKILCKEQLYNIFCLQSDFMIYIFHCFMLLLWLAFFFWCVYHQHQKFKFILLTTVVGWFFYFPLSWHWHLPNHSTAIMAYIYCQTQHFWKNITKGFCVHLWFHYMTTILVMQICIWFL